MKNWVGTEGGKVRRNVPCVAYSSTRASFMKKLQQLLEDVYEDFESL